MHAWIDAQNDAMGAVVLEYKIIRKMNKHMLSANG